MPEFGVIYSIDVPSRTSLAEFTPPHYSRLGWQCTESGESEYGYLFPYFNPGRHRKHCALLPASAFHEFVDHVGLYPEDVETLGSLGAPGSGFGWAPAISFNLEHAYLDVIGSAYVTPYPTPEDDFPHHLFADDAALPGLAETLDDRRGAALSDFFNQVKADLLELNR